MGRIVFAAGPGTIEAPKLLDNISEQSDRGWIVTVFNNDYNTEDEVIMILIVATGCNFEEANLETWEIHNLGRSVVHHGRECDCRRASEIIAKIGIKVEVNQE